MFDRSGLSLVESSLHVSLAHADPTVVAWNAEVEQQAAVQFFHLREESAPMSTDDAAAARALADLPGPRLADQLDRIRVERLSGPGRLDFLNAQQRLASWVESLAVPALVDHAGLVDQPNHLTDRRQQEAHHAQAGHLAELAAGLKCSENLIRVRVDQARALTSHLPATMAALRTGVIGSAHARAMVDLTAGLDPATAQEVEQRVVPGCVSRGGAGPLASFRQSIRRALVAIAPEIVAQRFRQAARDRGTSRWTDADGSATLSITSTPPDIDTIHRALTALAGPADRSDPRSLDNRRVDALVALCTARLECDAETTRSAAVPVPSRRPEVSAHIVIDLPTLLGLADNPSQLAGYGPIPAATARDWLSDATTWRRLVTDPVTGHLLDYGRLVRHPPPRLKAFINARDQTCRFPGCSRPARHTDADHITAWHSRGRGGPTSAANLQALCRHHHNLKTYNHWHVIATHPDRTIWQSPSGRLHTRYRPAVLSAPPVAA